MASKPVNESDVVLGRVLQRLRKEKGLTPRQFAVAIGYKDGSGAAVTISRIENGGGITFEKLQAALGVFDISEVKLRELEDQEARSMREAAMQQAARAASSGLRGVFASTLSGARGKSNLEREAALIEWHKRAEQRTAERQAQLARSSQRFDKKVGDPFMRAAHRIDGDVPNSKFLEVPVSATEGRAFTEFSNSLRNAILLSARNTALGAAAGAGAGAASVSALTSFVVATASASTGTALSTLSGAALTSATYAYLGGGALAAGGSGVAAGTLLLTGVFAVPVVLVTAVAVALSRSKNQKRASQLAHQLSDAEHAILVLEPRLEASWQWAARSHTVLSRLATLAAPDAAALRNLVMEEVHWDDLSAAARTTFTAVSNVVVTAVSVQTLPVAEYCDIQKPDETASEIADWIELVLSNAEALCDELDERSFRTEDELVLDSKSSPRPQTRSKTPPAGRARK